MGQLMRLEGFLMRGYWQPLGLGGKLGPRFISAFDAGRWANKHWGAGMWTLQWREKS
jgi:hypothetical protein